MGLSIAIVGGARPRASMERNDTPWERRYESRRRNPTEWVNPTWEWNESTSNVTEVSGTLPSTIFCSTRASILVRED